MEHSSKQTNRNRDVQKQKRGRKEMTSNYKGMLLCICFSLSRIPQKECLRGFSGEGTTYGGEKK